MPSRVVQSSHTSVRGALNERSSVSLGRIAKLRVALVGALQAGDVELLHLEHRLQRGLGIARLRIAENLAEHRRHYLPRKAEPVLEPAAGPLLSPAGDELRPVVVDL